MNLSPTEPPAFASACLTIAGWASHRAQYKSDRLGLDRVRSPAETIETVRRVMSHVGITRVSNLTALDRVGLPVVAATRPNSRSVAVSLGKGITLDAAKASAMMEALECFHAEHIELPLVLASVDDMQRRERLADVERLARSSVGAFTTGRKLLWVKGIDIVSDEHAWLPYEVVHCDYTLPLPTGSGAFLMSSNGIASGNHVLEAVSHGICELVERDANSLWRATPPNMQAARLLDLGSIDDRPCLSALEAFRQAELTARVWDTTTDVGIACFRCELSDLPNSTHQHVHPVTGSGCHPRREIALLRALTEAAQGRLTLISGARDDLTQSLFQHVPAPESATLEQHADRRFGDAPTWDSTTLEDDVRWQLRQLWSAGLYQVVVVDLTKPEIDVPVVRVVVPGLEGICEAPGYLPGARLRRALELHR